MRFRLINTGFSTPAMNMAIDEALLNSELPVLRLYQWKPAGLSLGYFQNLSQINTKFCQENNIGIVRRLTGGNAVLHDNELTYSFIIDENIMPGSVLESYKHISRGILKALDLIGLKAAMNEQVEKQQRSAVCFNDPSWYEIIADGKKIVGSAQKRINSRLLQHGAILLDINIAKYAGCFNGNSLELIENLEKRITCIQNETRTNRTNVSPKELAQAMKKGFQQALGIEFIEDKLTDEELNLAKALEKQKYSTAAWNNKF